MRLTSMPFLRRSSLLLAGAIALALGLAPGCKKSDPGAGGEAVTWHQDIAPMVYEHCGGCHTEGNIGSFSIETYEEAYKWASKMEREIVAGTMPPWGAEETDECTPPGSFKDDIRLSEEQIALFQQWIDDGRPEGDPEDAAPLPEPPTFTLENPTRQLTIPTSVDVEGTSDRFVCFVLDPEITEPVWLTGSQVEPGNPAIVHHALTFLDRNGESLALADETGKYDCFGSPLISSPTLLSAWAPGSVATLMPADTGTPLLPGDKMVIQVHYHPTGSGVETDDSTRVDLRWVTEEPDYVANTFLIGNFNVPGEEVAGGPGFGLTTGPDFSIPAGATEHIEENRFLIPGGEDPAARLLALRLWVVGTHMHYVGTDMKITATDPDGAEQCLVQTPNWDFNWQRGYFFEGSVKDLPAIYAGDTLTMRCTYDNSLDNPFLREALDSQGLEEPIDVSLGEETLDEMCLGVFGVAVPKEFKSALGL